MVTQAIDIKPVALPLPPDDVKWSSIQLSEVLDRGTRFEAALYDVDGKHAREVLLRCRWQIVSLWSDRGFIKTAFYPTRFKRIYVDKNGVGLLLPSQINELDPKPTKFMSPKTKANFEQLKVKENEVLMTRSGTIGNCTLVSKTLAGKVFSDDVIRITLNDPNESGYVYAFLRTDIGNTLVQTNNYGAVVSHIEPEHLKNVPIPNPSPILKTAIHNLITESFRLRDESNDLIAEAHRILIDELKLPPIDELRGKQFDCDADFQNFSVKLSRLAARFEATYHKPVVDSIVKHIEKEAEEVAAVSDPRISRRIILPGRFKRVYVEEGQGVPFFGGKELLSLDPRGDKFLSARIHKERIETQLTIKENMVMVTCSGTIGKVALAPKHWEGWTANQHVLRVVPSKDIAGYLYIWFSSDYGYELIRRFTYGAVVHEIDDNHMAHVQVPLLKNKTAQARINELALKASQKRYEAFLAEQEALDITNKKVIYAADVERESQTATLAPPSPLRPKFRELVDQWRRDTQHTSSLKKMVQHPAYQQIIEMGKNILPLLFAELEARRDHWLVALNAITGRDPAPAGCTFAEAVDAWLTWGREKGYLSSECGETERLRNVSQN